MTDQTYDNTNQGALFRNDRRESERHPEYTGSINVEGKEFYLSAWVKESKAGRKYFSLSVQPKQVQESDAPPNDKAPPF